MRISIGHRLFASVLLAILVVTASGVLLMRHKVLESFSDYAVGIELDRLDELSGALAQQYRKHGGWRFVAEGDARRGWIAGELGRLQHLREMGDQGLDIPAPAPVAAQPVPRAVPSGSLVPDVPPAPPAPPAPPLPPPSIVADADGGLALQHRVTLLDARGAYLAGMPLARDAVRRAIESGGRTIGYLAVAKGRTPSDAMALAFLNQLGSSVPVIVGASVLLSALAAMLLAAHFRKPIHRLADAARGLAGGRFDVRLPVERSDELGELAHSFNQLAQQLANAEQSRRQWVADTSHELRTPLSVLRAQLEAVQDGVRSASPETVAAMLRQVLSLNKLIDELYALARTDLGEPDFHPAPLDLWQLATEMAGEFGGKLAAAGLSLEIGDAPQAATVAADPARMRQVFSNLLENSVRYTSAGGVVRMHALVQGDRLLITIDDSAPGVPDTALARLAERFYRVDASRSRAHGGAGLGLSLCARIAAVHGADLEFAHSPLGGLRTTLSFPLEPA